MNNLTGNLKINVKTKQIFIQGREVDNEKLIYAVLMVLAVLFISYILVSWLNVILNNITTGNIADWNIFKIMVTKFG